MTRRDVVTAALFGFILFLFLMFLSGVSEGVQTFLCTILLVKTMNDVPQFLVGSFLLCQVLSFTLVAVVGQIRRQTP
jgi:hypothetical protein